MRKAIILFFVITILSAFFTGCSEKQCEYCDSLDVQYTAFFVPGQSNHYLCEECYRECNKNPTFDDYWIVNPI